MSFTTIFATNVWTTNLGGNPPGSAINLLGNINGGGNSINNINIGNVTPGTGAFTTLSSTSTTNLATGAGCQQRRSVPLPDLTTINGQTVHNGAGIGANNVITVNNVPAGQYGPFSGQLACINANGIKLTNATGTGTRYQRRSVRNRYHDR